MKTILHHQNISHLANDIFVIDGEKSEYGSDIRQPEAMSILNSNSGRIRKLIIPQNLREMSSPAFNIYIGWDDIFIVSTSKTKDEKGRYISYRYYNSSYKNTYGVIESLRHDVREAGLEINENDVTIIKWVLDTLPTEKKILGIALGICVLLPIFISIIK